MNNVLFSSQSDNWRTPPGLFNYFNNLYHFTLDAAASPDNALCANYFDLNNSALGQDWQGPHGPYRVWCNPPYTRGAAQSFFSKAVTEVWYKKNAELAVFLLPARTDTKLWQDQIFQFATEIIFLKGRVKFLNELGQGGNSAPFPSAIVVLTDSKDPVKLGTLRADPLSTDSIIYHA